MNKESPVKENEAVAASPKPQLSILREELTDQGCSLINMLSKAADVERALYGRVMSGQVEEVFKPRPGEDKPETFPGHVPLLFTQSQENTQSLRALDQFLDSIIDGLTGRPN